MKNIFIFFLLIISHLLNAEDMQSKKILIVYGSTGGSTAEIAYTMKDYLEDVNCTVDIMAAEDKNIDFLKYDLIIIGSGIYGGAPHKNIKIFIDKNRSALSNKKTAVFAVCGLIKSKYTEWEKASRSYTNSVACGLVPLSGMVFAGKIPDLGWFCNIFQWGLICGIEPGDYRDWDKIKIWTISLLDFTYNK